MHIKYIGKINHKCHMCTVNSNQKYLAEPHKSIKHLLTDDMKGPHYICEKCAKRESPKNEWKGIRRSE